MDERRALNERRRFSRPREVAAESLCLLLQSARELSGVEALALADATGVLVAGAGAFQLCEEVAAQAPLHPSCPERATLEVTVRALDVEGQHVLLCGVGSTTAVRRGLDHAAEGTRRILGSRRTLRARGRDRYRAL